MSRLTRWLVAGFAATLLPLASATAEPVFPHDDLVGTLTVTVSDEAPEVPVAVTHPSPQ